MIANTSTKNEYVLTVKGLKTETSVYCIAKNSMTHKNNNTEKSRTLFSIKYEPLPRTNQSINCIFINCTDFLLNK